MPLMIQVGNMVRRPFIALAHDLQFLFMMGERRLVVEDFTSKTMILKTFWLGPFMKGASFRRDPLFPSCTRLARTVLPLVPFCPPT